LACARHFIPQEELSLAKAAEIAGVSWAQMRDILLEQGIDPALGPESLADAEAEVAAPQLWLGRSQASTVNSKASA
jgi:hypothetical protein